jgi:Trypsin
MARPKRLGNMLPRSDFKLIQRVGLLRQKLRLPSLPFALELAKAAPAIQVRGGMKIQCDGAEGTSTIACFKGAGGKRVPVLVTAKHVVGGHQSGQPVSINGIVIGNVSQVATSRDVAFISLKSGVTAVPQVVDIFTGNMTTPSTFTTRAVSGDLFMIGAKSGKKTGTIVNDNASAVTFTNSLTKQSYTTLQGLLEILPQPGNRFGVPGDSGSPVLQDDSNGMTNLVGLLVAVDESTGHAYAEHFGGGNGLAKSFQLFQTP